MRVWLLNLVLFFGAAASLQAQGKKLPPPFNQPFLVQLVVRGYGSSGSWNFSDTTQSTGAQLWADSIQVNPNDSNFSFRNDTLRYEVRRTGMDNYHSSKLLEFAFDTSQTNSITGFFYDYNYSSFIDGLTNSNGEHLVGLRDLKFDSTCIYFQDPVTDSDHWKHVAAVTESDHWCDLPVGGWGLLYSVSSVDVFGIFRPSRLVNGVSLGGKSTASNFDCRLRDGILECSFDPSDHSRVLERYSPLGARISTLEIAPEQHSVTLPKLANGLYFIRFGETVVKVSVSE